MDFWAAIQVARRRWHIVVGAFVLSVALAALTYKIIPTQYASYGVVVLTSPANGAKFSGKTLPQDVEKINPLLAFDSSLTTTAEIIGQILRDPQTQDELGAGVAAPAAYTVANGDATTTGPFLFVTVVGNSPEASQSLVKRVLDRASSELRDRQRAVDAPESTFIQTELLVKPTTPEAKVNGKIRYVGAALALALIATLAATFSIDNVLLNRRRRRDGNDFPLDLDGPMPSADDAARPTPATNGSAPAPAPRRPTPGPRPSSVEYGPASIEPMLVNANSVSETVKLPSRRPKLGAAGSNGSSAPEASENGSGSFFPDDRSE